MWATGKTKCIANEPDYLGPDSSEYGPCCRSIGRRRKKGQYILAREVPERLALNSSVHLPLPRNG